MGKLISDGPLAALLAKHEGQHKYDHGHALIVAGGPGTGGAARLAARGALRIGAGLVTVACPEAALVENAAQLTAIMLAVAEGAADLAAVLDDRRFNALGLGPGLGLARARDLVPVALAAGRGCVLDADAISAWADAPDRLFAALHGNVVLTPHGGEFARLFPDLAQRLAENAARADVVRAAAARAGAVVLLKGAQTVIAAPDGQVVVHRAMGAQAVPWLATAGAGDVLTGFIAGLMARGAGPLQAAEAASVLHARAARKFGPGLIAEDLPEALPAVFRDLGL